MKVRGLLVEVGAHIHCSSMQEERFQPEPVVVSPTQLCEDDETIAEEIREWALQHFEWWRED